MGGWGTRVGAFCAVLALLGCDPADSEPDRPARDDADGKADGYGPTGFSCGDFPRVAVDTAGGLCAGLVAQSDDALFKPRVFLELPGRNGEFIVSDLGNWQPEKGRLWYLDSRDPEHVVLEPILGGLTVPHQVIVGPGDLVYFGEDTRIAAFPLDAIGSDGSLDEGRIEVVIDGLPPMDVDGERNSMHPVTHFVFDADGDLFVNVGAFTDHCDSFVGRRCQEADVRLGRQSDNPKDWGAVLRRYDRVGDHEFDPDFEIVAFGLRNSMGLLFTPQGDLLQAENGRDFPESDRPFEELNLIPKAELDGDEPPHHYGWPYCYDAYETSDEWRGFDGFDCSPDNEEYRPPHILLPPHGAPLGLTYYDGDRFEELKGQLIVPLHGFRAAGQRILTYEVGDDGTPIRSEDAFYLENPTDGGTSAERPFPVSEHGTFSAVGTYIVNAWFAVDGFRPKGAPVAPYVASDGSIWVADDKNKSLLRFDRAEGELPPLRRENLYPAYRRLIERDDEVRAQYEALVEVLHSRQCEGCHDDFVLSGDESRFPELRYLLALGTWITPGKPDDSALFNKLTPVGQAAMPPIGREWETQQDGVDAVATVGDFIESLPELSPELNDGWIGGQCTPGFDVDCPFEGGTCLEGGSCTLTCTIDSPFCPDRDGMVGTFCVDLGDGTGGCVATCDPDAPDCLPGQSCVPEPRFGRTSPVRHVCR
jgi:glucose/arabinose dehydrogenase